MIISDLNHLESVAENKKMVGGSYGYGNLTSIGFSVYNYADVYQDAYSYSTSGKATSGIGNSNANSASVAYNTSKIDQFNVVYGVGIDP